MSKRSEDTEFDVLMLTETNLKRKGELKLGKVKGRISCMRIGRILKSEE